MKEWVEETGLLRTGVTYACTRECFVVTLVRPSGRVQH